MTKKATILYDPQMFDSQDYGGISRYFANLISGVKKSVLYEASLPLVYSSNYYVRDFPQLLNNKLGHILMNRSRKRSRWNQFYAIQQIKKSSFDILHATYYNPYFLEELKKPLVITVHDMIYENYPGSFPEAEQVIKQKKTMIESASLIIAISEYTKKQIRYFYPNLLTPIQVVYHGLPDLQFREVEVDSIPKKFLLYVGDRFALYKNFKPFIEAITPILIANKDLYLVCAGGGHFSNRELSLFKEFNVNNKVSQVNASDSLLKQLYASAMMFIYPSLEEGFGLPLLEAFSNGCAVAGSNCSSLPEIGGNALSYFDPLNIQSMWSTIQELVLDTKLREKRIQIGFEQMKKFNYETSVRQTLECYQSLL
jgi:glycosyltransferase involved in cell wall biosynthesis